MMPEQQGPVTIDAVVALLRDDRMRGFRIDIETDSLVEADQTQERNDRTAFVQAIGGFFKEFGPIVQQQPAMAPLAGGLLQFAVRSYKVGAELEDLRNPLVQVRHGRKKRRGHGYVSRVRSAALC